jgi:hypothetical protein
MNKKLALAVVAVLLLVVIAIPRSRSQDRRENVPTQNRFLGAWHLAWLEEPDANGQLHRADCTGLLVYTPDGHMSVQVMYRNPQPAKQAAPVQYTQGGYEASFGTYRVDEPAHTFTYHVDGALVRSLVGKDLPRAYEFSGNQLIVKSANPSEHWRVAWQHD